MVVVRFWEWKKVFCQIFKSFCEIMWNWNFHRKKANCYASNCNADRSSCQWKNCSPYFLSKSKYPRVLQKIFCNSQKLTLRILRNSRNNNWWDLFWVTLYFCFFTCSLILLARQSVSVWFIICRIQSLLSSLKWKGYFAGWGKMFGHLESYTWVLRYNRSQKPKPNINTTSSQP